MKRSVPSIFIFLLICVQGPLAIAQQKPYSTQLSLGVSAPLLDEGWGVHLGVNPTYRLFSWCSAEAQFSYLYTRTNAAFISGKKGHEHVIQALGGPRLYLNAEINKHRWFINILFGINRIEEFSEGLNSFEETGAGLSTGFFYTNQKLVVGLCLETPQNLMLKAGIKF